VAVLVVGDSVITQAATALVDFAPPGVRVTVSAALGSAPCDWAAGFPDPVTKHHDSFRAALARVRPRFVVLMFTGNPGLSGPNGGCVDANHPYDLDQLLGSYTTGLRALALQAGATGATVYLERPPPRNPLSPVGFDRSTGENSGYQGTQSVADAVRSVASSAPRGEHWLYADLGAALVSGPGFTYREWMPCTSLEGPRCFRVVAVRGGPADAVHLDPSGCGAILFAVGIEAELPQHFQPANDPDALRQDRARYPLCRTGEAG
jgi:hypothetical protein